MVRGWRRLSFQSKLLISFFMLGIIPSICIGTIAYKKSVDTLESRVLSDFEIIAGQLSAVIEREVEDVDEFSTFPYFTPEIFQILNQPYVPREQWGYQEISSQLQLAKLLTTYPSIFSTIQGIVFYSANGNIFGYRVSDRSSINEHIDPREEEWYKQTIERDGGISISGLRTERQFNSMPFATITASRVLVDEQFNRVGIMAVHISPNFINKLVSSFKLENLQVAVVDASGGIIYSSNRKQAEQLLGTLDTTSDSTSDSKDSQGRLSLIATEDNPEGVTGVYVYSSYLGWTSYLLIDRKELLQDANVIRNFTIILVVVFLVAAGLVALVLSRGLTKPIRMLIDSMREVERGLFKTPEPSMMYGEIGHLQQSYVRMVQRLDVLVQSIEEKERQKQEAELYALRARITPHFLYNTVNSIRMLAILQQSDQIAKLLQSLNMLIRANIRLERELVPLEAELDLLRNYVRLMELRYTNRFEVLWTIPADALNAMVPPMILQPIIENAIFHGSLERGAKIVIEVGVRSNGEGLHIWIADNGQGIESETLGRLNRVTGDQSGKEQSLNIGIANVRDRIQLRFGSPYSLRLESKLNEGTKVLLHLPYIAEKKEHSEQEDEA